MGQGAKKHGAMQAKTAYQWSRYMGQMDELAVEKKSRAKRAQGGKQASTWSKTTQSTRCDVTAVEPVLMGACIIAVANAGAAMMVSTTRDGGAVSITVFDDDDKERVYAHSIEEIEDILRGLIEHYS